MTPVPPDPGDLRLDEDVRKAAEARSRALTDSLGDHPSAHELVDYHFDVLTPEEAEAVQEHLSLCRECAQVVLDLSAFSRPEAGQGERPDLDREWDRLQARLGKGRKEPGIQPSSPWRFPWALAASFLMILGVILGVLGWNLKLREGLRESQRPRADVTLATLAPESPGAERGSDGAARVEVRPRQSRVLLLLNLGDLREFPGYRLELVDPILGDLWGESGVARNSDGTFLLDLPAALLESKLYRVRLYGQRGGDRVPLAEYAFDVVREDLSSGGR